MTKLTQNTTEGTNATIGGYILNAVCFLTMVISIRVPEYADVDRQKHAYVIYFLLMISHFVLAVYRYWFLHVNMNWRNYIVVAFFF